MNPDAIIEFPPELAAALTADDEETKVNASLTLLRAGEVNPDAVRAQHEQLTAVLDDPHLTVWANCCTSIGNADAPVPVAQLQSLEDDPDERVREQAAWALDRMMLSGS